MIDQDHFGTAASSSSNSGESEPSEWTCPGCGQIITKARCGKCYKCRGGKMTKIKIPPESETATAEQPPPNLSYTSLQPETSYVAALSALSFRASTSLSHMLTSLVDQFLEGDIIVKQLP